MVAAIPAAKKKHSKVSIPQIKEQFMVRYIESPLSYWDDGDTAISGNDQKTVHGLIFIINLTRGKVPTVSILVCDTRCKYGVYFADILHPLKIAINTRYFFCLNICKFLLVT